MNYTFPKLSLIAFSVMLAAQTASALTLNEYVGSAIESSPKILALNSLHDVDVEAVRQEEAFYHPSLQYEHSVGYGLDEASSLTLRSNLLKSNRSDLLDGLRASARISQLDVDTEASNMRASITSSVYKIFLYEQLIADGRKIIGKAKVINVDIKQKVEGGLAKISESTTAMVLLKEMESSLMAQNLKIDQLKLEVEKVTGVSYPELLDVKRSDIDEFIASVSARDVFRNKSLEKKRLEADSALAAVKSSNQWYNLDLYAKTEGGSDSAFDFGHNNHEVGLELTIDLVNPTNYWKGKGNVHKYESEKYMLQQLNRDTGLSLKSQLSILDSNKELHRSQVDSIRIKKNLISERNNEYQINLTSLYELIQSWNSYYATMQQKTDTEATLVDTTVSVALLTGAL